MKLSIVTVLSTLFAVASALAPSSGDMSRTAFLSATAASVFGATVMPQAANAGTMAQEYVSDPTEQWETGKPTAAAKAARMERFSNARTQMNSSFPPIKRLTLERKSPVTRLDINAPNFTAYKKTYPGLFKDNK